MLAVFYIPASYTPQGSVSRQAVVVDLQKTIATENDRVKVAVALDDNSEPIPPFDRAPGAARFKCTPLTGEPESDETVRERLSAWTDATFTALTTAKGSPQARATADALTADGAQLAPNGRPSNLNAEQYAQVRAVPFRREAETGCMIRIVRWMWWRSIRPSS